MKKRLIRWTFPFLLLIGLYFIGSQPDTPRYELSLPVVPSSGSELEELIARQEGLHKLKPDNQARIVWADSSKARTRYAVVYLHGFSASQKEGDPVHLRFASAFNCNLFLARIADHGIDTTEALLTFTADRAWESAKQALAIGLSLGDKVILMGTSTGATLALKLAAEFPDKVYGLINLSPNIEINNPAAFLLNDPWGLQIARMVMGGDYRTTDARGIVAQYWNNKYRLESVVQLQELVESTMTKSTFERVKQPSLLLYYYKSDTAQDPQVRVDAMLRMQKQLATPDSLKEQRAIPTAGAHVIGSSLASKDVETVFEAVQNFAITKLKLVKQ